MLPAAGRTSTVSYGVVLEVAGVDDQRVTLPAADGVTWYRTALAPDRFRVTTPIHVNHSRLGIVLTVNQDQVVGDEFDFVYMGASQTLGYRHVNA